MSDKEYYRNSIIQIFEEFNWDIDAILDRLNEYLSFEDYGLSELDKLHVRAFMLSLYNFKVIENHCIYE